jgi:hypothetical protein
MNFGMVGSCLDFYESISSITWYGLLKKYANPFSRILYFKKEVFSQFVGRKGSGISAPRKSVEHAYSVNG